MNNRIRNRLIVGIIVVIVVIVSGYYGKVFRPNERIIKNCESLLQEGEFLLTSSGNIVLARRTLSWIEEGLPSLELWYAFPTHRARGKRLDDAKESFKKRIDEREALQKRATSIVDDLLIQREFEKANQELKGFMLKTGHLDEVMKALLGRIQNGYYVHVAGQVNSAINAGEYQQAKEKIEAAAANSLGENLDFRALSYVIERVSVQDFVGAEKGLRDAGLAQGNSELQKEIADIVRLGKEANITKQALVAEKVGDLIKNTRTPIRGFPRLQGKVMVWDYTKKTVEQAYEMLRDDLRASPHDTEFTIFGIRKRWDVTIGRYSISNQPALREYMEIGVVYWPSMSCPGYAKIEGGSPPAVRPVTYVPGRGSSVNIKNWIEGNVRK